MTAVVTVHSTCRGSGETDAFTVPAEVLVELVLQVDEAVVGGLRERDVPQDGRHRVRSDLLSLTGGHDERHRVVRDSVRKRSHISQRLGS